MNNVVATGNPAELNRQRLFLGSCLALIATSVAFATVGGVMASLKSEFILTNEQIGWIGGAALWGFAVSQLVFSPLCDTLGMRLLLRLAFVCHVAGVSIMMAASGFTSLFVGALVIALANGLVEAACNPLVAALYPDDKTVKLNRFHVWFPGGIVLGGLAVFAMDSMGLTSWQLKLSVILIPTIAYGVLMLRDTFPVTEGVKAGVSMGQMFKATFTTPLFLLLLACMAITASTELGPNRWIPAVLEAGGMPGILVLVWISGLMAVLRYKAGPVVRKFSPTGVLLGSAIISAIGLYWLSYAETATMAFASATVFAVGVCYFWPTMLGFASERVPRSGALGLGLLGAVGMAVVGLVTAPQMGRIADTLAHDQLPVETTIDLLRNVERSFHALAPTAEGGFSADLERGAESAAAVLLQYEEDGQLPAITTANALRSVIDSEAAVSASGDAAALELVAASKAILGPADNYGGRLSFRSIVPFTCLLILIFGLLYIRDKKAGGYRVEQIG